MTSAVNVTVKEHNLECLALFFGGTAAEHQWAKRLSTWAK